MRIPSFRSSILPAAVLVSALQAPAFADSHHERLHRDGSHHPQPAAAVNWQLVDESRFYLQSPPNSFTGLYRSQGIATDGHVWFFSWQYGLEIADKDFNSLLRNSSFTPPATIVPGIPSDLLAQGLDHVGDFDYYNGLLYASLDDSNNGYHSPHVALYNAYTLTYTGVTYTLTGPASNPNNDIASWVAVDPQRNRGYGKEWQEGNTINVYNLNDWSFVGTITMDKSLKRIQGAKVHGDYLYMSADDDTRSVYRLDLKTGHVDELFELPQPAGDLEVEGIAVREAHADHDGHMGCDSAPDIYVEMVVDPDKVGDDFTNTNLHVSLFHYKPVITPSN